MPVIEISSLSHPGVEMFCTLTEAQLRNRIEPDKGIFIVESPKVITRALDAGYEPLAILCEHKHIRGDASYLYRRKGVACDIDRLCPDTRCPLRHASS